MTADLPYSLEALQSRWQSEKTPQVGLRLAEEYRRKGDLEGSIDALATGLEVYPTHTASRVALSRYLVDGERFEEAVPHLEKIVMLDPTHLVANKLLVGAYAGVGRLEDARDKLDIYEMMAEGDSDIERLHKLLSAEGRQRSGEGAVTEATDSAADEASDGSLAGTIALDELADLGFEPIAEPLLATASPELQAEPKPAPAVAATAESPSVGVAPDDPSAQTVEDEPFGPALEVASSSNYWQEVAAEGIFSLSPMAGEPAPAATPAPAAAELREPELPAASVSQPAPPAPPGESPVDSTVTLGRLYLEQGHREQAAEVFESVLAREPDNEVAQRELESSRAARAVKVNGSENVEEASAADILERKRSALTAYLAQIRHAVAAGN